MATAKRLQSLNVEELSSGKNNVSLNAGENGRSKTVVANFWKDLEGYGTRIFLLITPS